MYRENREAKGHRFLIEALPLIASYFSGESVQLADEEVSVGDLAQDEIAQFAEHIRFRHALACCAILIPIIQRIGTGASTFTETVRRETMGAVRGKLDVPRYVSRRASSLSWPKVYPILVTDEVPSTPENALVVRLSRMLVNRLSSHGFASNSAELLLGRRYKAWLIGHLKQEPWIAVRASSSLPRLFLETSRRVARRQTGNEAAYNSLVSFVKDSCLLSNEPLGGSSPENFVDLMLSFPADEAFLDRIYEIWCIRSIGSALASIGARLEEGPRPLTESRGSPVYRYLYEGRKVEIWFQRSLPSQAAEWVYESTGKGLRGIPDVSVVIDDSHYLLFDAKNRNAGRSTRSEETYKMLGYFENFKSVLGASANWGAIAFTSNNGFSRSLKSQNGRRLELLSADPSSARDCSFGTRIAEILASWLSGFSACIEG